VAKKESQSKLGQIVESPCKAGQKIKFSPRVGGRILYAAYSSASCPRRYKLPAVRVGWAWPISEGVRVRVDVFSFSFIFSVHFSLFFIFSFLFLYFCFMYLFILYFL
jgi:hypothetical protein